MAFTILSQLGPQILQQSIFLRCVTATAACILHPLSIHHRRLGAFINNIKMPHKILQQSIILVKTRAIQNQDFHLNKRLAATAIFCNIFCSSNVFRSFSLRTSKKFPVDLQKWPKKSSILNLWTSNVRDYQLNYSIFKITTNKVEILNNKKLIF